MDNANISTNIKYIILIKALNKLPSEKMKLHIDRLLHDTSLHNAIWGVAIQSLDDEILKFLGRIHNKETALNSIKYCREAGIKNLSRKPPHVLFHKKCVRR